MTDTITRVYTEEIIDGSTFIGWFELFDIRVRKKIKLVNIKCHNIHVERGREIKDYVSTLLEGKEIYAKTFRDKFKKYATILAVLYFKDGEELIDLNDLLVRKHMAFPVKEEIPE